MVVIFTAVVVVVDGIVDGVVDGVVVVVNGVVVVVVGVVVVVVPGDSLEPSENVFDAVIAGAPVSLTVTVNE